MAAVPPELVALHLGLRPAVTLASVDGPLEYLQEVYLDDNERLDVPVDVSCRGGSRFLKFC